MTHNHPRRLRTLHRGIAPATEAEVARLEAIIEGSSLPDVQAAARTCIQQLRLRAWLHQALLRATRQAEAIEAAERARAADIEPPKPRSAKAPIPEEP